MGEPEKDKYIEETLSGETFLNKLRIEDRKKLYAFVLPSTKNEMVHLVQIPYFSKLKAYVCRLINSNSIIKL